MCAVSLSQPNAIYCPEHRRERMLESHRAWKRKERRTNPAWRSAEIARQSVRAKEERALGWPVQCAACLTWPTWLRPNWVRSYRGRKKTGAMCVRCRLERAEAERRRLYAPPRQRKRLRQPKPFGARRHGELWLPADDRGLRAAWLAGVPTDWIARALGRTRTAVGDRTVVIGVRRSPSGVGK